VEGMMDAELDHPPETIYRGVEPVWLDFLQGALCAFIFLRMCGHVVMILEQCILFLVVGAMLTTLLIVFIFLEVGLESHFFSRVLHSAVQGMICFFDCV
jgi:cobalamin biosynthesis protein CobD/CbiB